MKYLKEYEGFFSKINKSVSRLLFASNVAYRWYYQESEELEKLNFYQIDKSIIFNNDVPYYFKPNITDTIKEIIVKKYFDVGESTSPTDIAFFYRAEVTTNKKTIKKDFDSFEEMMEFVEKYIPEIETDTKKFNL